MRVGTDICKVSKFINKIDDIKFLNRVFTKNEIDHIKTLNTKIGRAERIAGKFSAKEAMVKLLGTGIDKGVKWTDMEILPNENGKPCVFLSGTAKQIFEKLNLKNIDVSISHTDEQAIAVCIAN